MNNKFNNKMARKEHAERAQKATAWINHPAIKEAEICRLLWPEDVGRLSTSALTSKLSHRKKFPVSWTEAELARTEIILMDFINFLSDQWAERKT